MYPLLDLIEKTAPAAGLPELKLRAAFLQSTLSTHAAIEDAVLRPLIQRYLPQPPPAADGEVPATDHQVIDAGLARVLAAGTVEEARGALLDTVAKTRRHFEKEETLIFGIAERELSAEVQERLGAEWAARRGVYLGAAHA